MKNSFLLGKDIPLEVTVTKRGSPANLDIELATAFNDSSISPQIHPHGKEEKGSEPNQETNSAS